MGLTCGGAHTVADEPGPQEKPKAHLEKQPYLAENMCELGHFMTDDSGHGRARGHGGPSPVSSCFLPALPASASSGPYESRLLALGGRLADGVTSGGCVCSWWNAVSITSGHYFKERPAHKSSAAHCSDWKSGLAYLTVCKPNYESKLNCECKYV